MTVTQADVLARWRSLSAVTDATAWTAALGDAELEVGRDAWGKYADLAVIHAAAHLMYVRTPSLLSSEERVLISETVGPVSRSYAAGASARSSSELQATAPGRELARLRRRLCLSTMVV